MEEYFIHCPFKFTLSFDYGFPVITPLVVSQQIPSKSGYFIIACFLLQLVSGCKPLMMLNTDASGYLHSFEAAKCLLGSLSVQNFSNLLMLFVYPFQFGNYSHQGRQKQTRSWEESDSWHCSMSQEILLWSKTIHDFVTVPLSELKVTLAAIAVNFYTSLLFFQLS